MVTVGTSRPHPEPARPTLRSVTAAEQRERAPIRVVIIDDHLVAEMQRVVLQTGGIEVLGLASDGAAGLALIAQDPPDVLILEPCLRGMDGLEVVRRVRASFPQVAVLLLTAHDQIWEPRSLLHMGASGLLSEMASIEELVAAVHAVAQGRTVTVSAGPRLPWSLDSAAFTDRERDVLRLLAAGQRAAEIAERLSVSPRTVERLLAGLRAQLDAHTAAEVVHKAEELGLLPPGALVR